jgi:hypothetical protein
MKVVRFGVEGTALAGAKSASELLQEETAKLPIYTFCQDLDDLLGGGVAVGEITELCGCPGIGKTQMCIQLCTSVQIPVDFGGYDGTAVYIDTEVGRVHRTTSCHGCSIRQPVVHKRPPPPVHPHPKGCQQVMQCNRRPVVTK